MELVFCDLCQQSVPLPDLVTGRARRQGERVVCETCLAAMEPGGGLEASNGSTSSPAAPVASRTLERNRRRASLILATVLSSAALIFSVVAAVLLLLRLERQGDEARRDRAELAEEVTQLRQRAHGLERLASRLVQEQIEGLRADVREAARVPDERLREVALAELEGARRELARELERELARDEGFVGEAGSPAPSDPAPAPERARSEVEERLSWLEDQLSDLRLRRDLGSERAPVDTGLPRLPYPGADDPQRAAVLGSLTSKDPALRAGALFALAAAGDRAAVRDVLPLLGDPHPYVRETAARLLERLDARIAVQPLIAALEDEVVHVREAAVTALRGITRRSFAFDPRADSPSRAAAVAAWKAWWREAWREFLYGEGSSEGG